MIGKQELKQFECPICLEYCRQAVESQCCGHAFCRDCTVDFIAKNKSCPYCRAPLLVVRQSKLLRRIISEIKNDCPNKGCQEKIACKDLEKHKINCAFKIIKCRHCPIEITLSRIGEHFMLDHREEAIKYLAASYVEKEQVKSSIISKISSISDSEIKSNFNPTVTVKNGAGRDASIGTNGKYYCKGKLTVNCRCCDGNCGPTNGQNCVDCMRLDKKVRGLGSGYLINSDGRIAHISEGKPACGCVGMMGSRCIPTNPCKSCKNMTLPRYATLL